MHNLIFYLMVHYLYDLHCQHHLDQHHEWILIMKFTIGMYFICILFVFYLPRRKKHNHRVLFYYGLSLHKKCFCFLIFASWILFCTYCNNNNNINILCFFVVALTTPNTTYFISNQSNTYFISN